MVVLVADGVEVDGFAAEEAVTDDGVTGALEGAADCVAALLFGGFVEPAGSINGCVTAEPPTVRLGVVEPCPAEADVHPVTSAALISNAAPAAIHRECPAVPGFLPIVIGRL